MSRGGGWGAQRHCESLRCGGWVASTHARDALPRPRLLSLPSRAQVLLVLQSRAFYQSTVCLEEVCTALEQSFDLVDRGGARIVGFDDVERATIVSRVGCGRLDRLVDAAMVVAEQGSGAGDDGRSAAIVGGEIVGPRTREEISEIDEPGG